MDWVRENGPVPTPDFLVLTSFNKQVLGLSRRRSSNCVGVSSKTRLCLRCLHRGRFGAIISDEIVLITGPGVASGDATRPRCERRVNHSYNGGRRRVLLRGRRYCLQDRSSRGRDANWTRRTDRRENQRLAAAPARSTPSARRSH